MALTPPTKIYEDLVEEAPAEVLEAGKETTAAENTPEAEKITTELWTPEDEAKLQKSLEKQAELQKKIEVLAAKNGDVTNDTLEQKIPNEVLKNWLIQSLQGDNAITQIGNVEIKNDSVHEHLVIHADILAHTYIPGGIDILIDDQSRFKLSIVLHNNNKTIEVMQREVSGGLLYPRTKSALRDIIDIKFRNFSEKIQKYIAEKEKHTVSGVRITKGELEAIEKKSLESPEVREAKAGQEMKVLESHLEIAKNTVDALLAKKEQAEIIQVETTAGILEGEAPVDEVKEEATTPEVQTEAVVENMQNTLQDIGEGTVLFYADGVMGGESTIINLPSEETKNKYVIKHSSGKVFKVTPEKLKELIDSGNVSVVTESIETSITENAPEVPDIVPEALITDTEIQKLIGNIKHKIFPISVGELEEIKNNREHITLTYPDAWEKVDLILSEPKNRILQIVEVLERRAKNPALKNAYIEAQECLVTLSEAVKAEVKNKITTQIEEKPVAEPVEIVTPESIVETPVSENIPVSSGVTLRTAEEAKEEAEVDETEDIEPTIELVSELGLEEFQNKLQVELVTFLKEKVQYSKNRDIEDSTIFLEKKGGVTVTAHDNQFEVEIHIVERKEKKKLTIRTSVINDKGTIGLGEITYEGSALVKSMVKNEPGIEVRLNEIVENMKKSFKDQAMQIENNILVSTAQ